MSAHQQWWSEVGQREEWEAAHPVDPDAAFRAALAAKFPQLASWPGKPERKDLNGFVATLNGDIFKEI